MKIIMYVVDDFADGIDSPITFFALLAVYTGALFVPKIIPGFIFKKTAGVFFFLNVAKPTDPHNRRPNNEFSSA